MIMKWLKSLFCKHKIICFIENVYGDRIFHENCRSIWKCELCGKIIKKSYINVVKEGE